MGTRNEFVKVWNFLMGSESVAVIRLAFKDEN